MPREDVENGELLPELCSRGSFVDGGKTAYVTLLCASLRQLFTAPRSFLCVFSFFFSTPSAPPCRQATWHCPRSRRSAAGAHRAAAADTGGHPRAQARALGKANPTISGIVRFNKASLPSSFHAPG